MKRWILILFLVGCKETPQTAELTKEPIDPIAPIIEPELTEIAVDPNYIESTIDPMSCAPANGDMKMFATWPTGDLIFDSDGFKIGPELPDFLDTEYLWVNLGGNIPWNDSDTNHILAINKNTGKVKGANGGLVYSDAACANLVGESFDYPIHQAGDVKVFPFEDKWYRYDAIFYQAYPSVGNDYYFKTEYGPCHLCHGVVDKTVGLKVVTNSLFKKQYSIPLQTGK